MISIVHELLQLLHFKISTLELDVQSTYGRFQLLHQSFRQRWHDSIGLAYNFGLSAIISSLQRVESVCVCQPVPYPFLVHAVSHDIHVALALAQ